jgi:predicted RNase H-like HicB family nuclease
VPHRRTCIGAKIKFLAGIIRLRATGSSTYPACASSSSSSSSSSLQAPASPLATSFSMPDKPRRGGRRPPITVKSKRDGDGRWIAEVLELPEVVVYADTETEARAKAVEVALQILTSRIRQARGA